MKFLAIVAVLVASYLLAPTALASFPGQNGEIAYTIGGQVWVTNPDGSGQHALTGNICAENVAWSLDGRKIAFDTAGVGACGSSIYVMDADGSHLKALTSSGCSDVQPAWSPDGSRIVFRRVGGDSSGMCDNELWTMKANGRDQQRLTYDGVNPNDQDPSWSPDCTKIAFVRFSPMFQIFVLNLATGAETNIDQSGIQDTDPDWSPDGAQITFTRTVSGLGNEIAIMGADGSNQTVLTGDSGNGDFESKWSPDGTRLAFIASSLGIYTMSTSGTDVMSLGAGTVDFRSISWQPCLRKCA